MKAPPALPRSSDSLQPSPSHSTSSRNCQQQIYANSSQQPKPITATSPTSPEIPNVTKVPSATNPTSTPEPYQKPSNLEACKLTYYGTCNADTSLYSPTPPRLSLNLKRFLLTPPSPRTHLPYLQAGAQCNWYFSSKRATPHCSKTGAVSCCSMPQSNSLMP